MNTATEEKASTSAVSDMSKDERIDKLFDLNKQERQNMETIRKAQTELARIQEERRLIIIQVLLDGKPVMPEALELTPEMANETIAALKAEFDKGADSAKDGYIVQEGMDFNAVETKLREEGNEASLASLHRMVKSGSRPAAVCAEGGRFCIAETFGQILPERANCVYDRKAEKKVGKENCNGNAVMQAQQMGVPLMERCIGEAHMAAFTDSNQYCDDYIQATEDERKGDLAPCVCRGGGRADVRRRAVRNRNVNRGWRGALWV